MELTAFSKKFQTFINKYKYVILIIILGVILLMIPNKSSTKSKTTTIESKSINDVSVDEELGKLLSQVNGAGEVKVLLTISSGAETIYQTNDTYSRNDSGLNQSTQTITYTDSERNEQGLIKQINPPIYQGAIILCQGADNPAVKLALINAVANATGLGTDKISVLKMK